MQDIPMATWYKALGCCAKFSPDGHLNCSSHAPCSSCSIFNPAECQACGLQLKALMIGSVQSDHTNLTWSSLKNWYTVTDMSSSK